MSGRMSERGDDLYYMWCDVCRYYYAPGPQESRCPHYKPDFFNGESWGNGKLSNDWLPEFGAAWLETPKDSEYQLSLEN